MPFVIILEVTHHQFCCRILIIQTNTCAKAGQESLRAHRWLVSTPWKLHSSHGTFLLLLAYPKFILFLRNSALVILFAQNNFPPDHGMVNSKVLFSSQFKYNLFEKNFNHCNCLLISFLIFSSSLEYMLHESKDYLPCSGPCLSEMLNKY